MREAVAGADQTSSFEVWRKRLHVPPGELQEMLHRLHVQEFVNWNEGTIEAGAGPQIWKDYLKVRYRLDVLNDPRALVVADALADSLKRAPHTMARHYKQLGGGDLRETINRFNCQRVPAVLFDYAAFSRKYKSAEPETIAAGLDAESNLFKVPQTVHLASCVAFDSDMRQLSEEERCLIAHTFEDGTYADANEIVWLTVDIESKLEVDADVARLWCERFETLSANLGFTRCQLWLV